MFENLSAFEITILDYLDVIRCPFMDKMMTAVSALGNAGIIWIGIGIILLFFKSTRKAGITVLIALAINAALVNLLIKPLVARVRPYDFNLMVNLIISAPDDFSFPSGHTSAAFAAAVALIMQNRKWGLVTIIFALFMGFSRIYLYVHYPTDVIAGALIGAACGYVSPRIMSRCIPPKD